MTTHQVIAHFKANDELPLLVETLQHLPRGSRDAYIDALYSRHFNINYIERPENELKDIIDDLRGD